MRYTYLWQKCYKNISKDFQHINSEDRKLAKRRGNRAAYQFPLTNSRFSRSLTILPFESFHSSTHERTYSSYSHHDKNLEPSWETNANDERIPDPTPLSRRFSERGVAEKMGFSGFKDKVVLDIGTRGGRNIALLRDLGARDVYGIDSDTKAIQQAINENVLDQQHAFPFLLQALPDELKRTFAVAVVFNCLIEGDQESFIKGVADALIPEGEIALTFTRYDIMKPLLPLITKYFDIQIEDTYYGRKREIPDAILVVGRKKPLDQKVLVYTSHQS